MLLNYHIGHLVLSSLCVGVFVAAGIWWCSFCRLQPAKLCSHDNVDFNGLLIKITCFCTSILVVKFLSIVIIDKNEYLKGKGEVIPVRAMNSMQTLPNLCNLSLHNFRLK